MPFAPGASADGIARAVAIDLGKRMGKTVVVENMTGAGGSQGLVTLAKSPPDGDTLGVGATGALLINPNLPGSTAPDLLRELAPVAKLIEVGVVVVANPKTGPKSIPDLIDALEGEPAGLELRLDRRSHRPASLHGDAQGGDRRQPRAYPLSRQRARHRRSHRAARFRSRRSTSPRPIRISSAGGRSRSAWPRPSGPRPRRKSRPSPKAGVPGFGRAGGFIGLFAPRGTPPAVVKRISAEVREILATPAVQANAKTLTVSDDL